MLSLGIQLLVFNVMRNAEFIKKNKRFIFVNLSINCGYNSGMNHGIAFLVPIIKRYHYKVACLNIRKEISAKEFMQKINAFNPSIVGFSCTSHQLKYLKKYSDVLRGHTEILQISGGVGSTLDPEWILTNTCVKGVCIGEGEIPLDNLLRNIEVGRDLCDTEGFHWSLSGTIKKNPVPQFKSDFSDTELPDHSIFEKSVVGNGDGSNGISIMLSRGCPYNCYYCCNDALSRVYPFPKGYFRIYPVEYSIRLIEKVIRQCPGTKFIHFEDDLLIANKEWFSRFADEYLRRIKMPYRVCARIECITPDILLLLKNSGCKLVFVGLESGDEQVRSKVLNRKYSNSLFIEKCRMIKESGLKLFTFNIVGFPFEGRREMENTFALNKTVSPHSGVCTFFYPYKHTELYDICQKEALLKNSAEMLEITNYNTRPSIKMTPEQERDCIYYQRKIYNYLLRQNELSEIADLPFGARKYIKALRHWVKSALRAMPALDKAIRGSYANIKIKTSGVVFIKNQYRVTGAWKNCE